MGKPKFIDLFAGCGGLSLGLMQAGWDGVFAVEKSPDAFQTLNANLCKADAHYKFDWPDWLPCMQMTTRTLLRKYRDHLESIRGDIDLIAGGPPCQGFSSFGLRNPNDSRNRLTHEYIRIVQVVQPKYLLLENVRGFNAKFAGKDEPFSALVAKKLQALDPLGYNIHAMMLNASHFGVPQPRARFILVGVRKDCPDFEQNPIKRVLRNAAMFRQSKGLNGHRISVGEAISDLKVTGKVLVASGDSSGFFQIAYKPRKRYSAYQKLMRKGLESNYAPNSLRLARHRQETIDKFQTILDKCPKGKSVPKEFREKHGIRKQCVTPLHARKLAHTVTTLPDDMIHYQEPRILTVRENARLQSFPDWFEFHGKYTTGGDKRRKEVPRYTQVGNAVPPLMAEAIGRDLLELAGGDD